MVHQALEDYGRKEVTDDVWKPFADALSFAPATDSDLSALAEAVAQAEAGLSSPQRIVYLAVPPPAFIPMIGALGASDLVTKRTKLVIEKPFGSDLDSACQLNAALNEVFDESQIFRIDHFLGKEGVQNILALRLANGLFEPAWDVAHLDYVQIDVPETLTIGERGAFYEQTGAFTFYLRTGKAPAETRSTVTLGFKKCALQLFGLSAEAEAALAPNELVFELADPGGVTVAFSAKRPGPSMALEPAACTFAYADSFNLANELEAYERLLHDVMIGDPTLFNDAAGIERLWEVAAPALAAPPKPVPYQRGSWGPEQASALVAPHRWHLPEPTEKPAGS